MTYDEDIISFPSSLLSINKSITIDGGGNTIVNTGNAVGAFQFIGNLGKTMKLQNIGLCGFNQDADAGTIIVNGPQSIAVAFENVIVAQSSGANYAILFEGAANWTSGSISNNAHGGLKINNTANPAFIVNITDATINCNPGPLVGSLGAGIEVTSDETGNAIDLNLTGGSISQNGGGTRTATAIYCSVGGDSDLKIDGTTFVGNLDAGNQKGIIYVYDGSPGTTPPFDIDNATFDNNTTGPLVTATRGGTIDNTIFRNNSIIDGEGGVVTYTNTIFASNTGANASSSTSYVNTTTIASDHTGTSGTGNDFNIPGTVSGTCENACAIDNTATTTATTITYDCLQQDSPLNSSQAGDWYAMQGTTVTLLGSGISVTIPSDFPTGYTVFWQEVATGTNPVFAGTVEAAGTDPLCGCVHTSFSGCCSLDQITATPTCSGATYDLEVVANFTKSAPIHLTINLFNSDGTVLATQYIAYAQSGDPVLFENLVPDGEVVQVEVSMRGKGCDGILTNSISYAAPSACCEVTFSELYTQCEDLEHYSLTTEIGYVGEGPFNLSVQLDGGNLGSYSEMVNNGATAVTFDHLPANGNPVNLSATLSGGSCPSSQNWSSIYTPPSCNGPCGVKFVNIATQCDHTSQYTATFEVHYSGNPESLAIELSGGATATTTVAVTSNPQTITINGLNLSHDDVQVTTTATGGDCAPAESAFSTYLLSPDDCPSSPSTCSIQNLTATPICTDAAYKTEVRVSFSGEPGSSIQISLNDGQVHSRTIYPTTSPAIVYFSDLAVNTGLVQVQADLNGTSCVDTQTASTTYTAPTSCASTDCTLNDITTHINCRGGVYELTAYLHYTGSPSQFFVKLEQQGGQTGTWLQSVNTTQNPAVVTFKDLLVDGSTLELSANMMDDAGLCQDALNVSVTAPSFCPCQVDTIIYERYLNGHRYDLKTNIFFAADGPAMLRVNLSNGLWQERMVHFSPATFWFDELECTGGVITIQTEVLQGDCGDQVAGRTEVFWEPLNCDGDLPPDVVCQEDCPVVIGEPYVMSAAELAHCQASGITAPKVCYRWETVDGLVEGVDDCTPTIEVCPEGRVVYERTATNNCGEILEIEEFVVVVRCAEVNITPDPVELCETGGTLILDAGKFYQNYEWSTTEITRTITISEPGTYSVTVTDFYGCQATDEVVINVGQASLSTLILPSEPSICPEEDIELEVYPISFPSNLDYEWSTGATTSSILVTEATNYSVTVTDEDGCIGVSEVVVEDANDLEALAEYFLENGFIAIPVTLEEQPPAFAGDLPSNRSLAADDRLLVRMDIEGLGHIDLIDAFLSSNTVGLADQWLSWKCEDFKHFKGIYEQTADVIWGHVVLDSETALTGTLYLGGRTTTEANRYNEWILTQFQVLWEFHSTGEFEEFMSITFKVGQIEQFAHAMIIDKWLEYLSKLVFACEITDITPAQGGIVPKCFWNIPEIQPNVYYTIADRAFASGLIDGAYGSVVGTFDLVKGLLNFVEALISVPYCKIEGFESQVDYEAFLNELEQVGINSTLIEGIRTFSIIFYLPSEEDCESHKQLINKVEEVITDLADVINVDWNDITQAYKDVLNFLEGYFERITDDNNEGRHDFGKLMFDLASLFFGAGEAKLLDKLDDVLRKLGNVFEGRGVGLLNKTKRAFVDAADEFFQANPAKKTIFKSDVTEASDEFWEFFNATGVNVSRRIDVWDAISDLPSTIRRNPTVLQKGDELLALGFSKTEFRTLATLDDIEAFNIAKRIRQNHNVAQSKITNIINNSYLLGDDTTNALKRATSDSGLGQLRGNYDGLKSQLDDAVQAQYPDRHGINFTLDDAGNRVQNGHTVEIENGFADLEDFTMQQSFQQKLVSGSGSTQVRDNLASATNQLRGSGGEFPSQPTKIAHIRINNPLQNEANLSRGDLLEKLQLWNETNVNFNTINIVIIENSTGVHTFNVITEILN